MSRGREISRLGLRRIIDQASGLNRTETRTNAMRQAEISIINRLMLPVLVVPASSTDAATTTPSTAPLQLGVKFAFLAGYSAVAGSPEATADATGRGGDTSRILVSRASGGSRASAALRVAFPLTAVASGGSTMTAAIHIV